MSISGIYSNRGDYFQMLIAMDWLITILADPSYAWLTIDSVEYMVDDVVIGKSDGSLICCQCKKNQTDFKAWSLYDLAFEIDKAYSLYEKFPSANIRFYSRDSFGDFAKIKEYAITQANQEDYNSNLSKELSKINEWLSNRINNTNPYDFLKKINFNVCPDNDKQTSDLKERLQCQVTNADVVYNALWKKISELSSREKNDITAQDIHKITRRDICNIVLQARGLITPPIETTKALQLFATISNIGRLWRRDIGKRQLPRRIHDELINAIKVKKHTILLFGGPGSGKTCIMLNLQDALELEAETNHRIVPLFIQAREFADLNTREERHAYGLHECWVDYAARVAESYHVVILIDSLDVLSIAREHKSLDYFLAQIERLKNIDNVTFVVACREFDRKYDSRILQLHWDMEIECGTLDWNNDIRPLLDSLQINVENISADTRKVILNPKELAIFVELAQKKCNSKAITGWELAQEYIETIIGNDNTLGEKTIREIEDISAEMLKNRHLSIERQRLPFSDVERRHLCSLNVIIRTANGDFTFGHQTLFDVFVIWKAIREGKTLLEFIQSLTPVPFVRPCIRCFLNYLLIKNRTEYRRQIRAVLTSKLAFHIKRLVAESYAEQSPVDDDWQLVNYLRNSYKEIYQDIYTNTNREQWFDFWNFHLVPILLEEQNVSAILLHLRIISRWIPNRIDDILHLCEKITTCPFIDRKPLCTSLTLLLNNIPNEKLNTTTRILDYLLQFPMYMQEYLGQIMARCFSVDAINHIKFWKFITCDITPEDIGQYKLNNKLHCQAYELDFSKENFLATQLIKSQDLLELVIRDIEHWSQSKTMTLYKSKQIFEYNFLYETSFAVIHRKSNVSHPKDSIENLFYSIEESIRHHAQQHSIWWVQNAYRLCLSQEGALRYIGIKCLILYPERNKRIIAPVLLNKDNYRSVLSDEIGQLIEKAFIFLNYQEQDAIINTINSLYIAEGASEWHAIFLAKMFAHIPCHMRPRDIQKLIDDYVNQYGPIIDSPYVYSYGGIVKPPFEYKELLWLNDSNCLRLLNFYAIDDIKFDEDLIGGKDSVAGELREASSRQPNRFLLFLQKYYNELDSSYRDAITFGISDHFSYLYGNLQSNQGWTPSETTNHQKLAIDLLDELEIHRQYWKHNYSASCTIESLSNIIEEADVAQRIAFLCRDFIEYKEDIPLSTTDLLTTAINTRSGRISEALMILVNNLLKNNIDISDQIEENILKYSSGTFKPSKAIILRRLPYLLRKNQQFGWNIWRVIMQDDTDGLWYYAEPCLYYSYKYNFEIVRPILDRMYIATKDKDLECWAHISTLASLAGLIKPQILYEKLMRKNDINAWRGATQIWTNHNNLISCKQQCMDGMQIGLKQNIDIAKTVANEITDIFSDNTMIKLPCELLENYFEVLSSDFKENNHLSFCFGKWLKQQAECDPQYTLSVAELYIKYEKKKNTLMYDHDNNYTQCLTLLFREAEELEQTDNGEMLLRVVELQDFFLAKGMEQIQNWLTAAERP